MAWCDDLEVPAVESGDLAQVEPLGKRYHAGIHGLSRREEAAVYALTR